MNRSGQRDYKRDILHRILGSGIRNELFIESFISRHDVVRNLRSTYLRSPAAYEEELEHWAGEAEKDYEELWLRGQSHVQEGGIEPKRQPRKRHASSVAGAWERQEALARYLALAASEDQRLIRFRKDVLSGRVLSEEEALIFLSSPSAAARNLRASLKMLRINPLDRILRTDYRVEDGQDSWGPFRKLTWGRHSSSTIRPLLVAARPIFPGDRVMPSDLRRVRSGRAVILPHPWEDNRLVVAAEDSLIGQMVDLVEKCLAGYPISKQLGLWFVLTGVFVSQDPVQIRYVRSSRPELSRTTITLEVESWLPPEEVAAQYRHAQEEILGKRPRSLKRDTLAVFDYVNQRKGKSWHELVEAWNQEHPSKRFKDRSNLYTTYERALAHIASIKPAKKIRGPKMVSKSGFGAQIFAGKWYILHAPPYSGYTGYFETREEALADPRSEGSEILTSEEFVARRNKERVPGRSVLGKPATPG